MFSHILLCYLLLYFYWLNSLKHLFVCLGYSRIAFAAAQPLSLSLLIQGQSQNSSDLVLVFKIFKGQPRPFWSSFQPNVPIFCVILRWKFFLSFLESWGVSLRIKVPPKIHKSSTEDPQKLHRRSTKVPQKNLLSPKGLFYMSIPSKVNVFTHDGTGRCLLLAC